MIASARTVVGDPSSLRHILGHYPTGVCLVTATQDDGTPVGMIVGSFTSVSLEPPLVAFLPQRKSISWQRIAATGRFCVNVLAEHQEEVCRKFTASVADRFEGIEYRLSGNGLPILENILAWIECDIDVVHEAGDHLIVVGRVRSLAVEQPHGPLLFFKGSYGGFLSSPAPI